MANIKSQTSKPVNVIIDKTELAEMREVTGINANATAILCAARKGVQLLKKVQAAVVASFGKDE